MPVCRWHGSIKKYFCRANQRMFWMLPRILIKLNFFSRHARDKSLPSLLVHQTEGPWAHGENHKIRNNGMLANGPSDFFLIGVQKNKTFPRLYLCCTALASMKKERFSLFFLLDPSLDRFSDHLFVSKQDKRPRERKLKMKAAAAPYYCPTSILRFH